MFALTRRYPQDSYKRFVRKQKKYSPKILSKQFFKILLRCQSAKKGPISRQCSCKTRSKWKAKKAPLLKKIASNDSGIKFTTIIYFNNYYYHNYLFCYYTRFVSEVKAADKAVHQLAVSVFYVFSWKAVVFRHS